MSSSAPPQISLCMIVKNEAQRLARCLTSVQLHVDEIIVVDTGSTDNTPEIARQFGAKVDSFVWCDDFAAARNYSLSLASGKWILILDADEELVVDLEQWKQRLAESPETIAYGIERQDLYETDEIIGGTHLRLYRKLPNLDYQGCYHEQLQLDDGSRLSTQFLVGIKILHHGNSDADILHKNIHRDIPLLEKMRQKEGLDLWRLDCLARKYIKVGRQTDAQDCYAEALDRLSPHILSGTPPEPFFWVPTLLDILGSQAIEAEDFETARLICQQGLSWCPHSPPLNYLAGELLVQLGFPLAATAYFQHCLQMGETCSYYQGDPFPHSFVTHLPAYALGCSYMDLQNWPQAKAAFELALSFSPDYEPAKENLKKVEKIWNSPF
jgi:tetratricopeptide (TPR) repeat protein